MKVVIFAIFSLIAVVSCEVSLPLDAQDAIPYEEHPMIKAILKEQHPELFEDDGTVGKTPFIIGGSVASLGQFPYQALLFIYASNGNTYVCGGTVLRHNWVLTAAHCVNEQFRYISVFLGVVDSYFGPAQWGTNVTSRSDVKMHSQYDHSRLLNDIALIRLKDAPENLLTSNSYINNISLPLNHINTDLVGMNGTASGFGKITDLSQGQSQFLKFITLPINQTSVCGIYGNDFIRNSIICVSTTPTGSTCGGDSGGPMTLPLGVNGSTVIVGVVSFGAEAGCQLGFPVGFTRVTYYLDWIVNTMNMSPKAVAVNGLLLIVIQVFLFFRK